MPAGPYAVGGDGPDRPWPEPDHQAGRAARACQDISEQSAGPAGCRPL